MPSLASSPLNRSADSGAVQEKASSVVMFGTLANLSLGSGADRYGGRCAPTAAEDPPDPTITA